MEASEDDGGIHDDGAQGSEDEVDGEDLMENMEGDYNAVPELDRYDNVGIDDDQQQELSMQGRLDVDRQLERQDRLAQGMQGRRAAAMMDDEYEDDDDQLLNDQMRQERMRMMREGVLDEDRQIHSQDDQDMQNVLDFEDVQGPLSIWLKKNDVIRFISRQFNQFLRNYKTD